MSALKNPNNRIVMMNRISDFLFNFPKKNISRIRISSAISFFIFLWAYQNNELRLETSFLIITPIIWIGGVFPLLWFLAQYQSIQKPTTIVYKTLISIYIAIIILLFVGPIVCYCLAKYSEIQADYYRSLLPK
jgi:hypothetical protein